MAGQLLENSASIRGHGFAHPLGPELVPVGSLTPTSRDLRRVTFRDFHFPAGVRKPRSSLRSVSSAVTTNAFSSLIAAVRARTAVSLCGFFVVKSRLNGILGVGWWRSRRFLPRSRR